jgi:hypothetical protein
MTYKELSRLERADKAEQERLRKHIYRALKEQKTKEFYERYGDEN